MPRSGPLPESPIQNRPIWVDWYTAQTVRALRAEGVRPVLLKGPAVARWLYADSPRMRPYSDFDLIVAPDERAAAEGVLTALGYGPPPRSWLADEPPHALTWARPSDGAVVDLHRTLHGCEDVDERAVWEEVSHTTETMTVGGADVEVPSIQVRALHVALHAIPGWGEHAFKDLERAVTTVPLAVWKGACDVARRLGVDDELGFRLGLVDGGAALAAALGVSTAPPSRTDRERRVLARVLAIPGWRGRARYVVRKVFPPRAYLAAAGGLPAGRAALPRAYGRRLGAAVARGPAAVLRFTRSRRSTRAALRPRPSGSTPPPRDGGSRQEAG